MDANCGPGDILNGTLNWDCHFLKLKTLWLPQTKVRSLQPLRGMPIEMLNVGDTPIESLDGIQESPLRSLGMARTPVACSSPVPARQGGASVTLPQRADRSE